jgi:hypothetical protein
MNCQGSLASFAIAVLVCSASPLCAQVTMPMPRQAISANPFGLAIDLFTVEYERRVAEATSAGIGGSYYSNDDRDYLNADAFVRYYPGARPLAGFAFGVKAGITHVDDRSYFGLGFDINWSWTLGRGNHFYMGTGFGLKRLFGTGGADLVPVLPTLRILNVGVAF